MKKTYWVKSHSHGVVEWLEMNGKQFYELITSLSGKGRFFADYGDKPTFIFPFADQLIQADGILGMICLRDDAGAQQDKT